jgi:hypothetical protein
MPIDYSKAKIYKLVSDHTDKCYIGSTCNLLSTRLAQHKANYKLWKKGKHHYVKSYDLFELGDVQIFLVEEFKCCQNKEQLHSRERYYIEGIETVNKLIPGRTKKEWCEANQDKLKEYHEKYREDHKDDIKKYLEKYRDENKAQLREQQEKPFTCECGSIVSTRNKSKHLKSKKHIDFTKKNNVLETLV